MKCFVTGGTGFIGSHVVKALTLRNHQVRVLRQPDEPITHLEGRKGVEFVSGDVRDRSVLEEAMEGVDRVYHLAAIYRLWTPDPDLLRTVNVEGTRNLMEAAAEKGVERIVHTSSLVAYDKDLNAPVTERNSLRKGEVNDAYTRSKIESHRLVQEYAEEGLPVVIVAPTLPVGPGDRRPTPTGRLLLSTVTNPVVALSDSNVNVGDVRDIAEGHVLAADKGAVGETYLLGGHNVPVRELARLVQDRYGRSRPVLTPPSWVLKGLAWCMETYSDWVSGEPPQLTRAAVEIAHQGFEADCSRARSELGYSARSLEESVESALNWFVDQEYLPDPKR